MEELNKDPKRRKAGDGPETPEPEPVDPRAMLEALRENDMYANKPGDDEVKRSGRRHTEASEN